VAEIDRGQNVVVPINPAGWRFQYLGNPHSSERK
jgi:hypothetical protein